MVSRFLNCKSFKADLNKVQQQYRASFLKAIDGGEIVTSVRAECLCGSAEPEKIASYDRFGLPFSAYICRVCGLIFTSPYISERSLGQYYNTFYHPLTFGTLQEDINLFSKGQGAKIYQMVKPYLAKMDLKIFEIGAGNGSNLREFTESACADGIKVESYGLEFNQKFVEYGCKTGIKLTDESLSSYVRNCNETFDIIILSHVLEHFTDISYQLKLLSKICTVDSIIYVGVPGLLDLKNKYVYCCDFIKYLTHAHNYNFSLSSLKYIMNLYGYRFICGNEKIESLFKVDPLYGDSLTQCCEANYQEIVNYLKQLEDYRFVYNLIAHTNWYCKRLVNKLSRLKR